MLAMRRWSAALAALAVHGAALAHGSAPGAQHALWHWSFEPWVVGPLLVTLLLYATGAARLWRHAGAGRGLRPGQVLAFAGGWLALVAALVSPLDALGDRLFSAHMVQHEILMLVAAPLLVLGRPLAAFAWALPQPALRTFTRPFRSRWLGALWTGLTDPLAAWSLHALALWAWHVPALFDAAVENESIHILQHTSFLASALLFWWAALGRDSRGRGQGAAMVLLFTTMLHTGALGALLTLAPTPWYPHYIDSGAGLGLDPVEDQQLGGLVMWVPGGLAYLVAGIAVAARWMTRRGRPAPLEVR
jgi:putative membrane protein